MGYVSFLEGIPCWELPQLEQNVRIWIPHSTSKRDQQHKHSDITLIWNSIM